MSDIFKGIRDRIDFRLNARNEYESRVVSKNKVLDIGGRNIFSKSRKRIDKLNQNPNNTIMCTDILLEYKPDIVDDICNTSIKPNSIDGIYCDAILEHVQEYWKAIDNIYSILVEGGEAFIYVPFFFHFHDKMDYHRFTFTEIERMLKKFSEVKIFVPSKYSGYGYVFWSILTMTKINRFRRVHELLTNITNSLLKLFLYLVYKCKNFNKRKIFRNNTFNDCSFFVIYLYINHGFCAWVKK